MLNTDLTDLSDVTDEAIEAALRMTGYSGEYWTPSRIRNDRCTCASLVALFARCIQAHYPEMIVDPVTAKAREALARYYMEKGETALAEDVRQGRHDCTRDMRLVLAGMAMERE